MSRPRHFSMLRDFQLADWLTLANAVCGTGAVFAAMRFLQDGVVRDLLLGMALIPLAFVFDALDGRVARWRKVASTLGRELDSLADVISFGVAPAALGYACGLQGGVGLRPGRVGHAHPQHAEHRQLAGRPQQILAEDEGRHAGVLQHVPGQVGVDQVVGAVGDLHGGAPARSGRPEHTPAAVTAP